jgi:hypothetical protein
MLDKKDVENVSADPDAWEKVIRKLRARQMPPVGAPRPDEPTYHSLVTYLETDLDRAAALHPNPGKPTLRRLNRAEYANVVRDLLALEVDGGSLLPPDDSGYGFDNIGDVLTVSPLLMERYMSAARRISRLAIGNPTLRPDAVTYDVPRFLRQEDRVSDALPFGSRGGIAIRHFFPLDGEYVINVRLKRNYNGSSILGLDDQEQLDVRLDGERVKLFAVGGETNRFSRGYGQRGRDPNAPIDAQQEPAAEADAGLEVRVPVKAGERMVGVAFVKETWAPEGGVFQPRLANREGDESAGVGSVTVSGPYDVSGSGETPSRERIFVCTPARETDEESCAQKILSNLARRAYRRPVSEGDLHNLLTAYKVGRAGGASFERGIELALRKMLVSPEFLFRIERDPGNVASNATYQISDLELASRLSFFLWSSIPDDELLDLAERGKLRDPVVLEGQVRRMLADARSKALVDNFAGQWLYLRNVRSISPDLGEFPDFDENLREAFQLETELFLESMLREDRSVLELLDADYTFLNERLARHYGIPNVYGNHFRRVRLADGTRRGLLGQGSILTVTSYANRTSPVIRGKWLLENFLGTPPPPPPPNVPALKEKSEDGRMLTMRQRMEAHRANPACATCHKLMDPLGFALENFDAIGRWRTADGGVSIDASGVLPDGSKFDGPAELGRILLSRPDQFVHTVAEKLLTYALGRGVEYYDAPAVRKILRDSASDGYRWSSLILGIVESAPFQMSRSQES